MKSNQRLDYNRLAEALGERGLVEPQALQHILSQCVGSGGLFPEILVGENHVSDWDLSRVVCEVFGLAFLTPEFYKPAVGAAEGIDRAFLHEHALVPLDRFGKLLTVAMPGLTPSQVLGDLKESAGVHILPIVSSVTANRRWLSEQLPLPSALARPASDEQEQGSLEDLEGALPADFDSLEGSWGELFDEGNAAVLLDLQPEGQGDDSFSSLDAPPEAEPEATEVSFDVDFGDDQASGDDERARQRGSEGKGELVLPELPKLPDPPSVD